MREITGYTFSEWLNELAEKYMDKPAFTCDGETLSFTQLDRASRMCAQQLMRVGMEKGDRVVLWGMNSLNWLICFLGITLGGGVATLMNYGLNAKEVTALTEKVGAGWALIGKNKIESAGADQAKDTILQAGVQEGNVFFLDDLAAGMTDSAETFDREAFRERQETITPRDTQIIIYTTGTSSEPKAVQLSPASLLANIMLTNKLSKVKMERICVALPLYHSFGLHDTLFHFEEGSHVICMSDLKPDKILDAIARYDIQNLTTVGSIFGAVTRQPDFEEKAAGRIRIGVVGGGFTTPTEMMRMEKLFDDARLLNGYGQTECSPTISANIAEDPLERRAVTVGRVLPGIDVRIWSEQAGFLPQGEIGEIVVKGPITMNGYYGLGPEEQPFDDDGWLHTGDLGRIDEDGMLVLAGRIKDIIIRKGENISPMEIEKVIMQYSGIQDVKVFGAPHPIWGESVEACVVYSGDPADENLMRKQLRQSLSAYKIPSHFFEFSSFPLNSNGKLDQRALKSEMLRKLRLYNITSALDDGLKILNVGVANRKYVIVPVCELVQTLTAQTGFAGKRLRQIRIAVEEMLTERIDKAYDASGEVRMELILMPQWLRIRFTDGGDPFRLDAPDASVSARIILANTDAYSSSVSDKNLNGCNLDWQYEENFDIREWLYNWKEEGKAEE